MQTVRQAIKSESLFNKNMRPLMIQKENTFSAPSAPSLRKSSHRTLKDYDTQSSVVVFVVFSSPEEPGPPQNTQ